MDRIVVEHQSGKSARVHIGRHALVVDQPVEDGGWDLGPTPTELFAASLAACVEYYAQGFLRRHDLDPTGLSVSCGFEMGSGRPARVGDIRMTVSVPVPLSAKEKEALAKVVDHCTVHNSLRQAPGVRIELETQERAA